MDLQGAVVDGEGIVRLAFGLEDRAAPEMRLGLAGVGRRGLEDALDKQLRGLRRTILIAARQ